MRSTSGAPQENWHLLREAGHDFVGRKSSRCGAGYFIGECRHPSRTCQLWAGMHRTRKAKHGLANLVVLVKAVGSGSYPMGGACCMAAEVVGRRQADCPEPALEPTPWSAAGDVWEGVVLGCLGAINATHMQSMPLDPWTAPPASFQEADLQ